MRRREKRSKPGWKWAFITLLLFNVGLALYLASMLGPLFGDDGEATGKKSNIQAPISQETVQATVTLANTDLERLLHQTLSASQTEEALPYIEIGEAVIIEGELSVMGFAVLYQIAAEPFAAEDGNLQLKVDRVELGSLSLPTKQVLKLLGAQLDPGLPLVVDADNQVILVLLSEIKTDTIERIKLEKIEKDTREYTFNITILKENLLQ